MFKAILNSIFGAIFCVRMEWWIQTAIEFRYYQCLQSKSKTSNKKNQTTSKICFLLKRKKYPVYTVSSSPFYNGLSINDWQWFCQLLKKYTFETGFRYSVYSLFSWSSIFWAKHDIKNYTCRSSASQKETQVPNFDHITNVNPSSNILLSLRRSKFFRKETGKRKRSVSFHIKFETFHVEFTRKCFFSIPYC